MLRSDKGVGHRIVSVRTYFTGRILLRGSMAKKGGRWQGGWMGTSCGFEESTARDEIN
jgi:hypothetical protein